MNVEADDGMECSWFVDDIGDIDDAMMRLGCVRVWRFSPQVQVTLSPGKNCFWNSPVDAWPVQHWTRRPKTSRWSLSPEKCLVGLRDGGILLEIANRPFWGALPVSGPGCQCAGLVSSESECTMRSRLRG